MTKVQSSVSGTPETKIITPKDGEKLTECVTIPEEQDEED